MLYSGGKVRSYPGCDSNPNRPRRSTGWNGGRTREEGSTMKENREQTSKQGVSRRQFLVGAGLAGLGVAGAGIAGCAPASQSSGDAGAASAGTADSASLANNPLGANAAVNWTFLTPPEDIA